MLLICECEGTESEINEWFKTTIVRVKKMSELVTSPQRS
jgi:hypothetical protein